MCGNLLVSSRVTNISRGFVIIRRELNLFLNRQTKFPVQCCFWLRFSVLSLSVRRSKVICKTVIRALFVNVVTAVMQGASKFLYTVCDVIGKIDRQDCVANWGSGKLRSYCGRPTCCLSARLYPRWMDRTVIVKVSSNICMYINSVIY